MSLVSQIIGFIFKSSRPSSSVRPLTACLYKPFKSYSQEASKDENISSGLHQARHERAPSTAEEFKRVAEEKLRAADQGVASQAGEKVYDGAEAATSGNSKLVDSVKERFKEHEEEDDYLRRSGDEDV